MKHNSILLVLLASLASAAAADPVIQRFVLDEHTARSIPVSRSAVTTFCFPSAIQAISGANVTADGKTPGVIQLDFKPGSFFFSVRALIPGATANLNVVWNRRIYVFLLSEKTQSPVLSVMLEAPRRPVRTLDSKAPQVTPTRLLGLLQRAKAYPILAKAHPLAVRGVTIERPNRVCDFGDFSIKIQEVFRFDEEDALVFHVTLKNKTNAVMHYNPATFVIRVGERRFYQSISDASGVIPPGTQQPAWFAIMGTPDGNRHNLSVKNDFVVFVHRLSAP